MMMAHSPERGSSLASLFPSMAMARLVVLFAVHPGGRFHVRELIRRTGLSSASLQHELRRLAEIGALVREDEGGRTFHRADDEHPAWRAWMLLMRSGARPTNVLREALVDAAGIDMAFVFGSWARGDARPDSDVDVLLVGSDEARAGAGRLLAEAELLIGRPLDVIGYDPDDFATRAESSTFLRAILREPRIWLRGGPGALTVAEAA
jgi:uncharacterized protein